jgi:hypothetical protein
MGKSKWNPKESKPKRSGVFRVKSVVAPLWDEVDSKVVEGFAWFDRTYGRWAGTRPTAQEAARSAETAAPKYRAGQDKEWMRA